MKIIGLTGGIGCGKSAAAEQFRQLGVPIIDVDDVNRQLIRSGQPCFDAVVAAFGSPVVAADGELDRQQLRQIIFADPAQRKVLEAILHPAIYQASLKQIQALQSSPAKPSYVILVVPLLLEQGRFAAMVDRKLVVDCPPDLQLQRVCQRDHLTEEQAQQIIQTQLSRAQRLEQADDVIHNDNSIDRLRHQVAELHQRYCQLCCDPV